MGTGEAAESFLGTQGDIWDSQSDMFLALIGAVSALVLLGKHHNTLLVKFIGSHNTEKQTKK